MRKQLFLSLQEKLLSIKSIDNTPLIRFFDLWHNNINYIEQPFDTPAVFVEFEPILWQTIASKDQISQLTFTLHVVSKYYNMTHSTSPLSIQSDNLDFLDVPELIHSSLHLSRLTNTGTIIHLSSRLDYSFSEYIQSLETFRCPIGYKSYQT